MQDFPYRVTGNQAVEALVAAVRSDPSFVTGCLVVGGAHGYTMEIEYMQRSEGLMRYRTWSDVQGIISTEERAIPIDFAAELARLRDDGHVNMRLPDKADGGRFALVVLATADGGAWVEAPTPLRGEVRGDTAVERILAMVFS